MKPKRLLKTPHWKRNLALLLALTMLLGLLPMAVFAEERATTYKAEITTQLDLSTQTDGTVEDELSTKGYKMDMSRDGSGYATLTLNGLNLNYTGGQSSGNAALKLPQKTKIILEGDSKIINSGTDGSDRGIESDCIDFTGSARLEIEAEGACIYNYNNSYIWFESGTYQFRTRGTNSSGYSAITSQGKVNIWAPVNMDIYSCATASPIMAGNQTNYLECAPTALGTKTETDDPGNLVAVTPKNGSFYVDIDNDTKALYWVRIGAGAGTPDPADPVAPAGPTALDFTDGANHANPATNTSGTGYEWFASGAQTVDGQAYTGPLLVLDNFNLETGDETLLDTAGKYVMAVKLPAGATVVTKEGTTNTIIHTGQSAESDTLYGVYGLGTHGELNTDTITFAGKGTLTITTKGTYVQNVSAVGSGPIQMAGGTVNLVAEAAGSSASEIQKSSSATSADITVTGGQMTLTGGKRAVSGTIYGADKTDTLEVKAGTDKNNLNNIAYNAGKGVCK